jgi:transcriptional regulator with XRE-family HTH domain
VAGRLSNENHVWVSDDLRLLFGNRMRELRRKLGISQEELADRCGLHRTYVGGIERGERNPSLINIGRIAEALEAQLPELFNFRGSAGNG